MRPRSPDPKSQASGGIQAVAVMTRLRLHWPEYLSEAGCLATFMFSAAAVATLLQHPASPWALAVPPGIAERAPMGLAMGLTAVAIVYSRMGQRSGAHMNPAVTLTFLRLGKIVPADAALYVLAQFIGGLAGIALGTTLLAGLPADPAVNYVATLPGRSGAAVAFVAEAAISFGMMLLILTVANHPRFHRLTGVFAGILVFLYITFEAPLSGMSMNAARSLGPAVLAQALDSMWIYAIAPLGGMMLAGEVFVRRHGMARVFCAKLHHPRDLPCIFKCRHHELAQLSAVTALAPREVSA